MKTVEIEIKDVKYSITRMNSHDAAYWSGQLSPILASIYAAVAGKIDAASALSGLNKAKYNDIVMALFEGIKKHESSTTSNIVRDGVLMYCEIKEDDETYLTLLKESFMLTFKDFFCSALKVFPALSQALSMLSSTQASETI